MILKKENFWSKIEKRVKHIRGFCFCHFLRRCRLIYWLAFFLERFCLAYVLYFEVWQPQTKLNTFFPPLNPPCLSLSHSHPLFYSIFSHREVGKSTVGKRDFLIFVFQQVLSFFLLSWDIFFWEILCRMFIQKLDGGGEEEKIITSVITTLLHFTPTSSCTMLNA